LLKTTGTEAEIKASRKVLQFNADGTFKQETTPPAHPEGAAGKGHKRKQALTSLQFNIPSLYKN
jgi:hypothetical protein